MKLNKKLTSSLLLGASMLATLGACSFGNTSSPKSVLDAGKKFDSIESGDLEMAYEVNSYTYGDYNVELNAKFERNDFTEEATDDEQESDDKESDDKEVSKGFVHKAYATENEESDESESDESESDEAEEPMNELTDEPEDVDLGDVDLEDFDEDMLRDLGLEDVDLDELSEEDINLISAPLIDEETTDPSRFYNYEMTEKSQMYADGQETISSGEYIGLDDTLYDKVFLTGSEADGKFVYDSRDVGISEYPIASYLEISPILESFELEENDIEVTKGKLYSGEIGNVFTLTPEQVAESFQGELSESALAQNILGLVSETNVDKVIFGIKDETFTVEAISTGEGTTNKEPSSQAETDDSEETDKKETTEEYVGSIVLSKKKGKVEITEPKNAIDLDEFSSLVELYYQQQEEEMAGQLDEDELYGDDAKEYHEENAESDEQEESDLDEQDSDSDE